MASLDGASGWSDEASVTIGAPPAAPTLISVQVLDRELIEIAWSYNDELADQVEIQRKPAGGSYVRAARERAPNRRGAEALPTVGCSNSTAKRSGRGGAVRVHWHDQSA